MELFGTENKRTREVQGKKKKKEYLNAETHPPPPQPTQKVGNLVGNKLETGKSMRRQKRSWEKGNKRLGREGRGSEEIDSMSANGTEPRLKKSAAGASGGKRGGKEGGLCSKRGGSESRTSTVDATNA